LSRGTHGFTFGARVFLAHVFRATNRAFRLLAVYSAFCTFGLLTLHLTFGTRADRVTHSWARRIIALPTTSRVAVFFATFVDLYFRVDFRRDGGDDQH